jgi:hypothetical protein
VASDPCSGPATLTGMPRWSRYGAVLLVAFLALALIAQARGVLGAALLLSAGLLLVCGGLGFVLAPLLRRRAGETGRPLLRRRSFVAGLAVTLAGAALTGYALWRLVADQLTVHGLPAFTS